MGRISSPVFVGRRQELTHLRGALDRAAAGEPRTVLIAGEAGVGKTRLAREFGELARGRGARTLVGACIDVGEGTLPYASIREALRELVRETDGARLPGLLGRGWRELARLVPEIGRAMPGSSTWEAPGTGQGPLFESLLDLFARLSVERPLVLVLEDVQWADRSTRDFTLFLARTLRTEPILLIETLRSDDLFPGHPLRPHLAELQRLPGVERIEMQPLDRAEIAALLAGIGDAPPTRQAVEQIAARSEGNPFFIEELAAAPSNGNELPPSLRDLLSARVDALSADSRELLRVASVCGRGIDESLLADVAGVAEERVSHGLREAVERQVLVQEHPLGERFGFRHALLREAVYAELLPLERRRLHVALARALIRRGPGGGAMAAEIAYHWEAARELAQLLPAAIDAGEEAEALFAWAEAHRHFERAASIWDTVAPDHRPSSVDRGRLLGRAAEAAYQAGEIRDAVRLAEEALEAVDRLVEPVRAGLLFADLMRYRWAIEDAEGATGAIDSAVALVPAHPPSAARAHVLAYQAIHLGSLARYAEVNEPAREALGLALAVNARREEGHARFALGDALTSLGQVDEGLRYLEEARAIGEEVGSGNDVPRAHRSTCWTLVASHRYTDALIAAEAGLEAARRFGRERTMGYRFRVWRARALEAMGRWDEALGMALDIVERAPPTPARADAHLVAALVLAGRGFVDPARTELEEARSAELGGSPHPVLLTTLLARLAMADPAQTHAGAFVAEGRRLLAGTVEHEALAEVFLAGIGMATSPSHGRAADSLGSIAGRKAATGPQATALTVAAGQAADWFEALRERAGICRTDRCIFAPFLPALVVTAEALLAGSGAIDVWRRAESAWGERGEPYPLARVRIRLVEAMLAVGASRDEIGRVIEAAWGDAAELRAEPLENRLRRLASRARVSLPARDSGGTDAAVAGTSSPGGPAGAAGRAELPGDRFRALTPRELEVLRHLATGETDAGIADALGISRKTASVHVSNLKGKLGVSNRVEAATLALRLGLMDEPQESIGESSPSR